MEFHTQRASTSLIYTTMTDDSIQYSNEEYKALVVLDHYQMSLMHAMAKGVADNTHPSEPRYDPAYRLYKELDPMVRSDI